MKKIKVQHNSKSINNQTSLTQHLAEQANQAQPKKLATRANKNNQKLFANRRAALNGEEQKQQNNEQIFSNSLLSKPPIVTLRSQFSDEGTPKLYQSVASKQESLDPFQSPGFGPSQEQQTRQQNQQVFGNDWSRVIVNPSTPGSTIAQIQKYELLNRLFKHSSHSESHNYGCNISNLTLNDKNNLSKMSTSDRNQDSSPNAGIAPPKIIGMTQNSPSTSVFNNKFNWNFTNEAEKQYQNTNSTANTNQVTQQSSQNSNEQPQQRQLGDYFQQGRFVKFANYNQPSLKQTKSHITQSVQDLQVSDSIRRENLKCSEEEINGKPVSINQQQHIKQKNTGYCEKIKTPIKIKRPQKNMAEVMAREINIPSVSKLEDQDHNRISNPFEVNEEADLELYQPHLNTIMDSDQKNFRQRNMTNYKISNSRSRTNYDTPSTTYLNGIYQENVKNREAILNQFSQQKDSESNYDPSNYISPKDSDIVTETDGTESHKRAILSCERSIGQANTMLASPFKVNIQPFNATQSSVSTARRGSSAVPQKTSQIENQSKEPNSTSAVQQSQAGFSINTFKTSIMSKLSNIFGQAYEQQEEVKPPKFLCQCGTVPQYDFICKDAYQWYRTIFKKDTINYDQLKTIYKVIIIYYQIFQSLLKIEVEKETANQIQRDLARTFPKHEYFAEGGKGIKKMQNVLTAFANYDKQVGKFKLVQLLDYVQGMNFIVGSLLYHCNEVMTFWLFVCLIEDCEMRDIYLPGLPGLYKHSQIIEMLIMENLKDVFSHFVIIFTFICQCVHNLKVEMYASDWIFGLFSSVIPLEKMNLFYTQFFQHKWIFFYRLILSILKHLSQEILQEDELWGILNSIKSQTHTNSHISSSQNSAKKKRKRNDYEFKDEDDFGDEYDNQSYRQRFVTLFNQFFEKDIWLTLIDKSMKEWDINEAYINKLLQNFDTEHIRFNISSKQ